MYTLSVLKEPLPLSFSRNPIVCAWNISPYSSADVELNTVLTVKLEVFAAKGLQSRVLQCRPDGQGNVQIDLQSMIDIYLEHSVPDMGNQALQVSRNNICRFAVSAVLTNDYEQTGSAPMKTYRAMKGGLPKGQNILTDFLKENLLREKQFMRYPFEGETKDVNEIFVLSALVYTKNNPALIANAGDYELRYRYRSYSGAVANAWQTEASSTAVNFANVVHLPFCVKDKVADYKTATAVEIEILLHHTSDFVIGSQKFYLTENRESLNSCIAYVNSLGGYDAISLYHIEEKQFNYSKTKAQLIDIAEFASKNVLKASSVVYDVKERALPKARTLPMSQQELDRLRALFLSSSAFVFRGKTMVPLMVNDNNLSIAETDGLFALLVSWEEQVENANYMPEGSVVEGSYCPTPTALVVKHRESNMISVQYAFAPGRYEGLLEILRTDVVAPSIELPLTENEGIINIDVSMLNVDNDDTYDVKLLLYTICGPESVSFHLSESLAVSKFSSPTVPILQSTTYEGAGYRTLVFSHGSSNVFAQSATNSPGIAWIRASAADGYQVYSGTTVAGAAFTFVEVPPVAGLGVEVHLSYSPPAGFSGTDILNFFAFSNMLGFPAVLQSPSVPAKMYIKVEGVDGSAAPPVSGQTVIYIRWDIDESRGEAVRENPTNSQKTYYHHSWLRFFSDPYGNNPIDLTGMGISAKIWGELSGSAGSGSGNRYVPLSGTQTWTEFYTKNTDSGGKVSEHTQELQSTNQYYAIL